MRTLALIGDHLLCGRLLESMDVVCQRIKALEAFEASGNWEAARWLELLPPQDVGVTPRNELRDAQKEQILEEQVRGSRAPWAARPGGNDAAGAWKGQWPKHEFPPPPPRGGHETPPPPPPPPTEDGGGAGAKGGKGKGKKRRR